MSNEMKLFAIDNSNWDYYLSCKEGEKPVVFAIAKEGSGCRSSYFGHLDHIVDLICDDLWNGEFTEFGRDIMKLCGFSRYIEMHDATKQYRISFRASTGSKPKVVIVTTNTKSKAYDIAYAMRPADMKFVDVTRVKEAQISA